jgi:hypothetical protein
VRPAEVRRITGGTVLAGGLAVLSGTGPEGDRVATTVVLCVLSTGVAACVAGYRVHVLHIRRDIEAREARGVSLLRQVEPRPRRAVCPAPQRSRGRRRPVVRCERGRRRYR